jgi:hypothetical protein
MFKSKTRLFTKYIYGTYVSDQISTGFLEYLKVSYTARVPSNIPLLAGIMGAGIMTFLLFSQPLHTVWAPCNHRSVVCTNEWRPLLSSGSAGFSVKVHRDSIMRFFTLFFHQITSFGPEDMPRNDCEFTQTLGSF